MYAGIIVTVFLFEYLVSYLQHFRNFSRAIGFSLQQSPRSYLTLPDYNVFTEVAAADADCPQSPVQSGGVVASHTGATVADGSNEVTVRDSGDDDNDAADDDGVNHGDGGGGTDTPSDPVANVAVDLVCLFFTCHSFHSATPPLVCSAC